jgi:hypothetical protein
MRKQPRGSFYALGGLLLGAAFIALLSGALSQGGLLRDPVMVWQRLGWPLLRLTGLISFGIFLGLVIEALGWADGLAIFARPFMKWGHISKEMGAAFTTAFVSGTTSLSMLMTFHEEGKLSGREVIVSVLLNALPAFLRHLPTSSLVIISLVGKAGVVYLGLIMAAALVRLGTVLTYTHFAFPGSESGASAKKEETKPWPEAFREAGRVFPSRLVRIILIVVPVYAIVVLASDAGLFDWLRGALAHGVASRFIPIESMSVVILSLVVESTSGYAAAGALLGAGSLSVPQTVVALLIGNIISTPIRAVRHQLPYYMSIFPPRLGLRLMLVTQAFRVGSLVLVGAVFVLGLDIVN